MLPSSLLRRLVYQLMYQLVSCTALFLGSSLALLAQDNNWIPSDEARSSISFLDASSNWVVESPLLGADHTVLYFTYPEHPRNLGNKHNGDIWLSHQQPDGSWGRALHAGSPINSLANDWLIGISADGKRLAVWRQGVSNLLDILVQGDRSWRIDQSIPLERGLRAATFDMESQQLIYSKRKEGQHDLFVRQLLTGKQWSEERALEYVNSALDEDAPFLSFDGRSLYFRRANTWFVSHYKTEDHTFSEAKELATSTVAAWSKLCISVVESEQAVGLNQAGQLEQASLFAADQPLASKLLTGQLQQPPSLEDRFSGASIRLIVDGQERRVYPDANGYYTLVVPADRLSSVTAEAPGYFAPGQLLASPQTWIGDLAQLGEKNNFSSDYYHREQQIKQLQQQISASREVLAELDQKRKEVQTKVRQAQLAAGRELLDGYTDPELESLRFRLQQAHTQLLDTLPPSPAVKKEVEPIKPQKETDPSIGFDELEAMKAKFRAQQEEKLQHKGQAAFRWQDRNPATMRKEVENAVQNSLIPTLTEELLRQPSPQGKPVDSLLIRETVSTTLFPSKAPAVYERTSWENQLIEGLRPSAESKLRQSLAVPIQESRLEEEVISANYTTQQLQLQAYQDSLNVFYAQQWAEESQQAGKQYDFTAKGMTASGLSPTSYNDSPQLTLTPLVEGQTIILPQIQFYPNDSRFVPTAFQELDRLWQLLEGNAALQLHITAHTHDQLSYLASQELSEDRAFAVVQYLSSKGIELERLSYGGVGRQMPLVPNDSLENKAKNQRIEVTIR